MSESRARQAGWARAAVADDFAPQGPQLAFGGLLAFDAVLRQIGGEPVRFTSWPMLALLLTALLCVAAFAVPWRRLPVPAVGLLPVLDIAAVGMARLDPQVGGAGPLLVLPALWLAWQFGTRGAWVAFLAALGLVVVPGLAYLGVSPPVVSRSLLLPVVALVTALAVAAAQRRARSSVDDAERKRVQLATALETIDDQRRFAEAILDTVDVGLVLLDSDGTYRATNRRHQAFIRLAYPGGHAGRAGQLGLVYAEDGITLLERDLMPTQRASQGEEFDDCLLWIGQDPLTNRCVSVSARSVRDEEGQFTGAALAYKDVTDFMRALRVKDEFVASVSHELRTPLTSIVGYVHILQEREDLPPDVLGQLGVVARNTDRLQRLVTDLLHTARVDQGPMHVTRTSTDLSQIVRDAVVAATPVALAAGLVLDFEVPERVQVPVDAQRIAQVLDNLLSNAIKYSCEGGRVDVRLAEESNWVELCVIDTGIGIEAADRDRLFTRFFRSRHSREQSIQGVGLGLSIVRSIVESHGGRIDVDSEVGKGSEFRVRLPLV